MKNILVPTDFSKNAKNAFDFAIKIANHFKSKITLLSVYQAHSPTGSMKNIDRFLKDENESQLSAVVKKHQSMILEDVRLEAITINGSTTTAIARIAKDRDIDLIVMGTQGASGLKEIFIGSNTVGVIKRTTKPVLAVPNGSVYKPFKKMVLALDKRDAFPGEQIKPLLRLAQSYNSKVLIYHIAKTDDDKSVNPSIDEYFKGLDYSIHESIGASDVNEGINAFVQKNEADLLCMITKKRSFLEGIFNPSVTRREAFNTPVPLLVLRQLG